MTQTAPEIKPQILCLFRHAVSKKLHLCLGSATQAPSAAKGILWTSWKFTSTGTHLTSEITAELGVLSDRSLVFRTKDEDDQMPGTWMAYIEVGSKAWLMPYAKFMEQTAGGRARFERIEL